MAVLVRDFLKFTREEFASKQVSVEFTNKEELIVPLDLMCLALEQSFSSDSAKLKSVGKELRIFIDKHIISRENFVKLLDRNNIPHSLPSDIRKFTLIPSARKLLRKVNLMMRCYQSVCKGGQRVEISRAKAWEIYKKEVVKAMYN